MKNLLSIESLDADEIHDVIRLAGYFKSHRGKGEMTPLIGQSWALIFSKASTRTRVSFEVGIRELGGNVMFLSANDIQLGRGEPIKDTARVLGRMVHGAVIRTFAQADVEEFAHFSGLPTINALTDQEHPCQILSDLFTISESNFDLQNLRIAFIGDGQSNVARSWIWAAQKLKFQLVIASPKRFWPDSDLVKKLSSPLELTTDPKRAAQSAEILYTDVWVSMGKEQETAYRLAQFRGYQVDSSLLRLADANAFVMHCLPAYRGQEIAEDTFEGNAETIFRQAENRLHTQKAILALISKAGENDPNCPLI